MVLSRSHQILCPFTTQTGRLPFWLSLFRHQHNVIHRQSSRSSTPRLVTLGSSDFPSFLSSSHLQKASINSGSKSASNMNRNSPTPGDSQHHTQNQAQIVPQTPTLTSTPNPVQDQLHAQDEHLNAQAAVLLNEFLAKTRRLISSELGKDTDCTICSEPFLRGDNPEVPIRLDCGHTFGMGCILKWLSPVSRDGNNSCPNCRKPIFDDWDPMDFPAARETAPVGRGRRVTAAPVRIPADDPSVGRDERRGPSRLPAWLQPENLPSWLRLPDDVPTGGVDPTAVAAEPVDATASTSPVAPIPVSVAPNAPLPSTIVATEEAWDQQQAVGEPQTVATNEPRTSEMSTPDDTASSLPPSTQRSGQGPASTISQREGEDATAGSLRIEEAQRRYLETSSRSNLWRPEEMELELQARLQELVNAYRAAGRAGRRADRRAARRPAAAATPAPPQAARATEDEDNGVAAMFNAAETEHDQQRQQAATNERKRHMWMQFREGVVRTIEQSADGAALANHDLALTIISMRDLDDFIAERATESPTWRRTLRTFPRLHTEMVTRFDDFRPLPSVTIGDRIELERLLAGTSFDREALHKAGGYTRLSERLARTGGGEFGAWGRAVARLTEGMANLSGPSRESTASITTTGFG